jgi:hypothetical protein
MSAAPEENDDGWLSPVNNPFFRSQSRTILASLCLASFLLEHATLRKRWDVEVTIFCRCLIELAISTTRGIVPVPAEHFTQQSRLSLAVFSCYGIHQHFMTSFVREALVDF